MTKHKAEPRTAPTRTAPPAPREAAPAAAAASSPPPKAAPRETETETETETEAETHDAPCDACNGTGRVSDFSTGTIIGGAAGLPYAYATKNCPECEGTGRVDAADNDDD